MLGGGSYPICVAEMGTYAEDADKLFNAEDHERLKQHVAFAPEDGQVIAGTGGVRKLFWPYKDRRGRDREALVLYFFRDLNMPLFLLALFADGKCEFDEDLRAEMEVLVNELVDEYGKKWRAWRRPENSA